VQYRKPKLIRLEYMIILLSKVAQSKVEINPFQKFRKPVGTAFAPLRES